LKIEKFRCCIPEAPGKYTFLKNTVVLPPEADAKEELIYKN
jgi:hypothetical protein